MLLTDALAEHGIDPEELPPVVLGVFMTSLSRMLVMEEGLDMSIGHAETRYWSSAGSPGSRALVVDHPCGRW